MKVLKRTTLESRVLALIQEADDYLKAGDTREAVSSMIRANREADKTRYLLPCHRELDRATERIEEARESAGYPRPDIVLISGK